MEKLNTKLEKDRFQDLTILSVLWLLIWTCCIYLIPAGSSGRNHTLIVNGIHGGVCTLVAVCTLYWNWTTTNSIAVTLSYFIVDLLAMIQSDGIKNIVKLRLSRLMDYLHHILGVVWGIIFFIQENSICDSTLGNPYVWMQTNEISTIFYNWFRLTNSNVAAVLFASSFFCSRIVFNTLYLVPRFLGECDVRYLYACMPFFVLQYAWFVMIVRKITRMFGFQRRKQN
ncbi:hypothetical protein ABG067_007355 [Albugo candida]